MEQEKDAIIADLQYKLDNMETDYEEVLHVSFSTSQLNTINILSYRTAVF